MINVADAVEYLKTITGSSLQYAAAACIVDPAEAADELELAEDGTEEKVCLEALVAMNRIDTNADATPSVPPPAPPPPAVEE